MNSQWFAFGNVRQSRTNENEWIFSIKLEPEKTSLENPRIECRKKQNAVKEEKNKTNVETIDEINRSKYHIICLI